MLKFIEFSNNFISDKDRLVKLVPFDHANTVILDDNSDTLVSRHVRNLDSTCIYLTHKVKGGDRRSKCIDRMISNQSKILVLRKLQYSCPIVQEYITEHAEHIVILRNISNVRPLINLLSEINSLERNVTIRHTIKDLEALYEESVTSSEVHKKKSPQIPSIRKDKQCPYCGQFCSPNEQECPNCGHKFDREDFNDLHQIRVGIVQKENHRMKNGELKIDGSVTVLPFLTCSELEPIIENQCIGNFKSVRSKKIKVSHLNPNVMKLLPGTLVYYAADGNKAFFLHRIPVSFIEDLRKIIGLEELPYLNTRVRGENGLRFARIYTQGTDYSNSIQGRNYAGELVHDASSTVKLLVKRKLIECDLISYLISELQHRKKIPKIIKTLEDGERVKQKDLQLDRLIYFIENLERFEIRKFVLNHEIMGIVLQSLQVLEDKIMSSLQGENV